VRPSLVLDIAGVACVTVAAFMLHVVAGLAVLGGSFLVLSALMERD
jgi:hypothetical protein